MRDLDWSGQLVDQLRWHWEHQLRPRLDGLTDEEYRWEPVAGCWSIHPDDPADPRGVWTIDYAYPPPDPAPVTTIAWRLAHVTAGVFGLRNHTHFGGPDIDYASYPYPGDAATALADLDAGYGRWIAGVTALSPEQLAGPCGEHGFEADPMAGLVLHIHREVIHHGAEISLLRDLHRARSPLSSSP